MNTLVLSPFSEDGLRRLSALGSVIHEDWRDTGTMWDPVELGERAAAEDLTAIVVERDFLFEETFTAASGLRAACIARAAVNQIDVEAATALGVLVINTPGRNAPGVAELTIGLLFSVARRIAEADQYVRAGNWESPSAPYVDLRGIELRGRTLGIVGFGAIGCEVAGLAHGIGMRVIAHDPFVAAPPAGFEFVELCSLDNLLHGSDAITLHLPPSEDGEPTLGGDELAAIRPGAILINTASAALVDTTALVGALSSGRLAGAGYDIFETAPIEPGHPLAALRNVVLTPHIGGATDETVARHSAMIATDLELLNDGEMPRNLVNRSAWERRRTGG